MSDDFHSETRDPECENAGCCRRDGGHVLKGEAASGFPDIKPAFSPSGIALCLLWCYKKAVSPLLPRCCRFTPTCSAYAAEAIMTHGLWKGFCLAVWRLMRCQPFCRGGYDPVPPRGCWHFKQE